LKERLISVSAVLMLVVTSLTHPSIYPTLKCKSDARTHFLPFMLFPFERQLHVTEESHHRISKCGIISIYQHFRNVFLLDLPQIQVLTCYNKDYDEWADRLIDGRTGTLTDRGVVGLTNGRIRQFYRF
jgi:hypothetical protein